MSLGSGNDRTVGCKIYAERLFTHQVLARVYYVHIEFFVQIMRNGAVDSLYFRVCQQLTEIWCG